MKVVNARELRHKLKVILDSVERGETIEIARRHQVIARIIPMHEVKSPKPWPDLKGRLNSIYGDKRITSLTASEIVYKDREDR